MSTGLVAAAGRSPVEECRRAYEGRPDSAMIDDALTALLARNRAAELDAVYGAYDEYPLDESDE